MDLVGPDFFVLRPPNFAMSQTKLSLGCVLALVTAPSLAYAGGPIEGETGSGVTVSASASTQGGATASGASQGERQAQADKEFQKRKDQAWIRRWAPEKRVAELGVYGGVFFSSPSHELFEADKELEFQGWRAFRLANADLGLRAAYYPLAFLGMELEGGVMPLSTDAGGALGYHVRGHVLGQVPKWSVTPFILLGAGAMGVSSDRAVVGKDVDPALHYGLGVKAYLNRYTMLRLDFRNIVSYGVDLDNGFNEAGAMELLLGVSVTLGREKRSAPPVEAAPPPAAPPAPADSDGDGFTDDLDACPDELGVEPDGCPISDGDGDGILDTFDKCPEEPGVEELEGCPASDTGADSDGDGLPDSEDKCVGEPETVNGFEDDDGCPDEVAKEVEAFTGVIQGIYFDAGKAEIKPASETVLRKALKVLQDYPSVKLEISGHTDSRGDRDDNLDLSLRRAEAVKAWLTEHGISGDRLRTEGFGPDQPIDSNGNSSGRAKNRRIEFKLM